MASSTLQSKFESYKSHHDRYGTSDELIKACIEAAKTAFKVEQDEKYGLLITSQTKDYITEYIRDEQIKEIKAKHLPMPDRLHTFWEYEDFSARNDVPVPIVDMAYEVYRLESYSRFESYMIYMERDRHPDKRFYLPRRSTLKIAALDMQRLEDDELDIYGLSMPSRVGKSTLCVFFLTWVGLRKPDSHNAMGGHSGQLAKRFFKGLSNIIETPEYRYTELFKLWHPEFMNVVQAKSSDPAEFTINLGTPDEFATYTCRGIDATWTGAVDVSADGYLYVDDLVRDREHSLSPSRMENTYQTYLNSMCDRCNDGAKRILVGTLWSVLDPLERERKQNEDNPRALFRKIPALNENDESNFQYRVKGFSTKYYIDMRARLDKAEWMAKFQQQPFVREGLTFPIEELKFYNGIVPIGSHRTVAHIDVALGGGDRLSMPVCKDYGDDGYIIKWVHDSRSPGFTVPRVVDAIDRYFITLVWIEKNNGGQLYADKVQEELDKRGINHCKIEVYSAPNKISKEDKIAGYSDAVKRKFYFLTGKTRVIEEDPDIEIYYMDADYRKAIDEMTTWSAEGKGKQYDDSADSIASLAMKMDKKKNTTTKIRRSPL